ncbi:MAG: hybrid sensor histidine kinase/response regulator [Thermodesulfobacteriota bacterium]
MGTETDELLSEVVTECLEHVSQMESLLLTLEATADEPDPEVVNSIFRSAHSIKGVTGFCGLNKIKELAHVFENVLNAFRQGALHPTPAAVDILLNTTDFLRGMLEDAANSENYDIERQLTALARILEPEVEPSEALKPGKLVTLADSSGRFVFNVDETELRQRLARGHNLYILRLDLVRDAPTKKRTPIELVNHLVSLGEIHETSFEIDWVNVDTADEGSSTVPLAVLFSSLIDPAMMAMALEVPEEDVEHLADLPAAGLFGPAEEKPEPMVVEPAVRPEPAPLGARTPERKTAPPPESKQMEVKPAPEVRAKAGPKTTPPRPEPAPEPMTRSAGRDGPTGPPEPEPLSAEFIRTPVTQVQSFLRVNVALLDNLMNMAGELVLGRNQLLQTATSLGIPALTPVAQRIDMITSELQAEIMQTRMQDLAGVFGKFPRLVRDLSRTLKKEVNLTIEGQEVELDKTIIESLGDPLVHIVRNSLDHGIETPEIRAAAGKDPVGQLKVRAYHEAGQVNIEISDDGAGIDRERLKQKAIQAGLITQSQAQAMSDQEALDLIFQAGLSTAEVVSEVSGRGVGMDVVKSNLQKLGGVLDLQSVRGKGTHTRIKLPLTMAIIPCLIVRLGQDERYAVPQVNLIELVRVRSTEIAQRIEKIAGAEVLRLRENLLPLIRLAKVLATEGYFRDPITNELKLDRRKMIADRRSGEEAKAAERWQEKRTGEDRRKKLDALNILVLSAGDLEYGLIVDELEDTEEIVVKPLGRHLKQIPAYAGATIMGDGRVAPILDVPGLAVQADLHRKGEAARQAQLARKQEEAAAVKLDMEKVLVFNHSPSEQFAVPIPLVARIERVETAKIEKALGHLSFQYRGGSLRLIRLDRHLPLSPFPETDKVFVIVFEIGGKEIGVAAHTLVDEKLVPFVLDTHTHQRAGVMGSMIIDNTTVMVIDIYELVQLEDPEWMEKGKKKGLEGSPPRVLLVEDSEFFLNKVSGYLEEAGFEVLTATNGQEGLDVLAEEKVDVVLADIEMPVMNGFEMIERIRANPKLAGQKIVALSSLAGEEDIHRGLAAGADRYLIKLDRINLVETIWEYCAKAKRGGK